MTTFEGNSAEVAEPLQVSHCDGPGSESGVKPQVCALEQHVAVVWREALGGTYRLSGCAQVSQKGSVSQQETCKSSTEGAFGMKLGGEASPAQAWCQYRVFLCIFFSFLMESFCCCCCLFFQYRDIFNF